MISADVFFLLFFLTWFGLVWHRSGYPLRVCFFVSSI